MTIASTEAHSAGDSFWFDHFESPFMRGNYRPVGKEVTSFDLPIKGRLPVQLSGLYLRNGPNPQFRPPGRYHPFDGDGMIHAVELSQGRAHYRNRWVRSRQLAYERKLGHAVYYGINDSLRLPEPQHMAAAGWTKNVANIHIVPHSGRLLAVSENGGPIELNYDLETVGSARFGGKKLLRYTGHPHRLPGTDEMLAFAYSPFVPFLRYIAIEPDGQISKNDIVPIDDPVMIHDFCVCGDYVVFLDAPAIFDVSAADKGGEVVRWDPTRRCRFGVLPIHGRSWEIRWFEVEPCFIFHYFNGFQDGDELVFVTEWYDRVSITFPEAGVEALSGVPMRYSLNLATGAVRRTLLNDRGIALPVVDNDYVGRKTRYGYAVGFDRQDLDFWNRIVRMDLDSGAATELKVDNHLCVSEPCYVPDPLNPREDAGFLVHFVTDLRELTSELWLLRAADVAAGPVAQIALPQRVPHGFHGSWLPTSDMGTYLRAAPKRPTTT